MTVLTPPPYEHCCYELIDGEFGFIDNCDEYTAEHCRYKDCGQDWSSCPFGQQWEDHNQ